MAELMGYDTTQNDGQLEIGIVTSCEAHRILIIDSGENGMDRKAKNSILKLILGGLRDYTQLDVGRFERVLTGIFHDGGRMTFWAI